MRILLFLSVVGVGFLPGLARADSTTEQITQCIDKLGSTRPVAREQAMRLLELAGEPALTALRKAAQSEDIDVSHRAVAILERIEKAVENRKYLEVARYDFKFDDEMLSSVVASLNRKLKTQLFLDQKLVANPKRTVTFEVKGATAFETIAKFMESAGLKESDNLAPSQNPAEGRRIPARGLLMEGRPYGNGLQGDANRIVLVDGKSDLPSVNTGPLRIRVLGQGKDQAVRTNGSNEISFKLDVCPITPSNWRGVLGVDVKKAVDEHGQNLTQSYLRETPEFGNALGEDVLFLNGAVQFQQLAINFSDSATAVSGGNHRHQPLTFFAGKNTSRVLKEVEGVVHGRMLIPPSTLVTIEDISKVSQKDTFKANKFSLQVLEVQLQAKKGQPAFVRYRMTTSFNPFQNDFGGGVIFDDLGIPGANQPQIAIQDSTDRRVPTTPVLLNTNNDGTTMTTEVQLQLRSLTAMKTPLKLVVTGQKEVEISVPFTLKNIQLP